jgi:hypothetical protein
MTMLKFPKLVMCIFEKRENQSASNLQQNNVEHKSQATKTPRVAADWQMESIYYSVSNRGSCKINVQTTPKLHPMSYDVVVCSKRSHECLKPWLSGPWAMAAGAAAVCCGRGENALTMMLMLNLICALHCTYRATTAESCR